MTLSAGEIGRAGRHDGERLYRPLRSPQHFVDAVLASQTFRAASDETRRLYRFAFEQGWSYAASVTAEQTAKE